MNINNTYIQLIFKYFKRWTSKQQQSCWYLAAVECSGRLERWVVAVQSVGPAPEQRWSVPQLTRALRWWRTAPTSARSAERTGFWQLRLLPSAQRIPWISALCSVWWFWVTLMCWSQHQDLECWWHWPLLKSRWLRPERKPREFA